MHGVQGPVVYSQSEVQAVWEDKPSKQDLGVVDEPPHFTVEVILED